VIAGDWQPPEVHALVYRINGALGNFGQTVVATDPLVSKPADSFAALRELVGEMNAGQVDLLVIVGSNPVYDAPADLDFVSSLKKVRTSVHFAQFDDETSLQCDWHIPQAHPFEHWSDGLTYDGTVTILQPLIAPLFGGIAPQEFFSAFTPRRSRSSHTVVREYWKTRHPGADYEDWWAQSVHDV
jgi:molybdopterin-containing oxidoreductase family iron-sulfur binding subunit